MSDTSDKDPVRLTREEVAKVRESLQSYEVGEGITSEQLLQKHMAIGELTADDKRILKQVMRDYKPEPGISVEEAKRRAVARGRAWLTEQKEDRPDA